MTSKRKSFLYPYTLDHKPGFFLGGFLYRLFKRVHVNENMKEALNDMRRTGTVVYAIKYRGKLDYLLYHYNFRRKRLPYPKIAFDLNISMLLPFSEFVRITLSRMAFLFKNHRFLNPYKSGFYEKALQDSTTCLMFLLDPEGFVRRFLHGEKDQIQLLLETQGKMERPIFIVPQLILYKKTPEKDYSSLLDIFFGFKDKPGTLRKIVLFFRHNRRAFIDFGEPLDLRSYLEKKSPDQSLEEAAADIRQILIESIDRQKRIVLGPIMKSRQQQKENTLMDPAVREQLKAMSGGDEKRLLQLRKRAGDYFDEIAADYNINYVQFFRLGLRWLWKKIFEGVDVNPEEMAEVRKWARQGTLIYVPSHKSHIDYLVLNYILYDYHVHIPRVAAGKNLAFWPMGHIFRKSGAFFIRRSFRRAKLYLVIFNRYIKTLLEEGHPIEFFIEGGRSRNGKLVFPKTGFLSILLQAFEEGFCKDLIFVPTAVVYDRIIEEKSYLKELSGGHKESENVGQMLRARRFLKRKYGKIYIRLNKPFSLNEYLSNYGEGRKDLHRDLAFHLIRSINAVSLVTPLSLIATAVLSYHRRGFQLSELAGTTDILMAFLRRYNRPLAHTLSEPKTAIEETIQLLIDWKIVDVLESGVDKEDAFYFVDDDKKLKLEYYKNSIIHFFINHALVAVSLLSGVEEEKKFETIISDYDFLKDVFKHEFVFDEEDDPVEGIRSMIIYFQGLSFVKQDEEKAGYVVTKLGFDKLPLWAALAKTYIESYWVAFKAITQQQDASTGKLEALLKQMDDLGRRFYKQGLIEHVGALSRLNFKNALRAANLHSPRGEGQEEKRAASEELSRSCQRLYDLSHYRS